MRSKLFSLNPPGLGWVILATRVNEVARYWVDAGSIWPDGWEEFPAPILNLVAWLDDRNFNVFVYPARLARDNHGWEHRKHGELT